MATISSDGENTYLLDVAAHVVNNDCDERPRLPEEIDSERQLQLRPCEGWIGHSYVNSLAFEWVTAEPYPGPYINWWPGYPVEDRNKDPFVSMWLTNAHWYKLNNATLAYYFAEYDCGDSKEVR